MPVAHGSMQPARAKPFENLDRVSLPVLSLQLAAPLVTTLLRRVSRAHAGALTVLIVTPCALKRQRSLFHLQGNYCGSLACAGGVAGTCVRSKDGGWAKRRVECGNCKQTLPDRLPNRSTSQSFALVCVLPPIGAWHALPMRRYRHMPSPLHPSRQVRPHQMSCGPCTCLLCADVPAAEVRIFDRARRDVVADKTIETRKSLNPSWQGDAQQLCIDPAETEKADDWSTTRLCFEVCEGYR